MDAELNIEMGDKVANNLNTEAFYNQLLANDEAAWQRVRQEVVRPILEQAKYKALAKRQHIELDDVMGYLYLEMMKDNRLETELKSPQTLIPWFHSYIRKFILDPQAEKHKRTLPLAVAFPTNKNSPAENPLNNIPDRALAQRTSRMIHFDEKEIVQEEFDRLWQKDPLKACMLFCRIKHELPTKDIQSFFEAPSSAMVDKILQRTRKNLAANIIPKFKRRPHL